MKRSRLEKRRDDDHLNFDFAHLKISLELDFYSQASRRGPFVLCLGGLLQAQGGFCKILKGRGPHWDSPKSILGQALQFVDLNFDSGN